jgi:sigma-B regulation protein RsbU (phosphoserine phosphatase)
MNDFFCDNIKNNLYFSFTAFIGNIKDNCLTFCNAGHPYPLVYRAVSGDFFLIEENGFIVGIMKEAEYVQMQTEILSGDFIILYSDGFQNNSDDEQLTVRAWIDQLTGFMRKLDMISMTAQDVVYKIKQNFLNCPKERCSDDTSIMVLKIL